MEKHKNDPYLTAVQITISPLYSSTQIIILVFNKLDVIRYLTACGKTDSGLDDFLPTLGWYVESRLVKPDCTEGR